MSRLRWPCKDYFNDNERRLRRRSCQPKSAKHLGPLRWGIIVKLGNELKTTNPPYDDDGSEKPCVTGKQASGPELLDESGNALHATTYRSPGRGLKKWRRQPVKEEDGDVSLVSATSAINIEACSGQVNGLDCSLTGLGNAL